MAPRSLFLAVALRPALATLQLTSANANANANAASETGNPVQRVVLLLQAMVSTLKTEAQEDKDLHKKLSCWCNDNGSEKDAAISAAQNQISDLKSTIDELGGSTTGLKTEIGELNDSVAKNKEALAEGNALREKEAQEFRKSESDALVNIEAVKDAIGAIERNTGALPQVSQAFIQKAQDMLDLTQPLDFVQVSASLSSGLSSGATRELMMLREGSTSKTKSRSKRGDEDAVFGADHEDGDERAFDSFMERGGYATVPPSAAAEHDSESAVDAEVEAAVQSSGVATSASNVASGESVSAAGQTPAPDATADDDDSSDFSALVGAAPADGAAATTSVAPADAAEDETQKQLQDLRVAKSKFLAMTQSDAKAERAASDAATASSSSGASDWAMPSAASADAAAAKPSAAQRHAAPVLYNPYDQKLLERGLKAATVFMQSQQKGFMSFEVKDGSSQSGEIVGILKQLLEQIQATLKDEEKKEVAAAKSFTELQASKTKEIDADYALAEKKEDELAQAEMDLAESKEDLEQTTATLSEDQKYAVNLAKTCKEGDAGYELRRKARNEETIAVSQAMQVLTEDEARDTMGKALSFLQEAAADKSAQRSAQKIKAVSKMLLQTAQRTKDPALSVLATSVEMFSFGKVKQAIDEMIVLLKQQQEDEVKKNDWCNSQLHENDMHIQQATDERDKLQAEVTDKESIAQGMADDVKAALKSREELQVNLQRASENRKTENHDFQYTQSDQMKTQVILLKAIEKLEQFYAKRASALQLQHQQRAAEVKKEAKEVEEADQVNNLAHHWATHRIQGPSLVQTNSTQTPPAQAEYSPNAAAPGVIGMMEKLIQDSKALMKDSHTAENEAQAQYEQLVSDTFESMDALQLEISAKTERKAQALKDQMEGQQDLLDTVDELQELSQYNLNLHAECDYITKNFDTRQQARQDEVSALQEAKGVLGGAMQK